MTNTTTSSPWGLHSSAFLLALLCFILPFMELSCSGERIMQLTGVQLVTGTETANPLSGEKQKIPPADPAVWALVGLVIGLIAGLGRTKTGCVIAAIAGLAAAASLYYLKTKLQSELTANSEGLPLFMDMKPGYWGALVGALAGAALSFGAGKTQSPAPVPATTETPSPS